ncbi:MAG: metalloregulator ArsR/SmtB family transcription factor [Myxococcales bacterium]|nr:metalloregulator ArsR/SmtB family transcription factor [Myxococcales bacterium]
MGALETTSDSLQLLGEPSRLRLLSLLGVHEMTVGELVEVTGLTQSRVSTHLGKLREAGLVIDRRVGTAAFYRRAAKLPETFARLWEAVAAQLDDRDLKRDLKRAERVVRGRAQGASWPDAVAGAMERHYSPGRTWEATCRALTALLQLGDVLDVGSGDGAIAELLAPECASLTCLDQSPRVSAAAAERLARFDNVRSLCGDMHALPFEQARFDRVLMLNVLSYSETPGQALSEAARVLRPGGSLCLVTLAPHQALELTAGFGHVRGGLSPSAVKKMLLEAGLRVERAAITSREARRPHFEVVTAVAHKKA